MAFQINLGESFPNLSKAPIVEAVLQTALNRESAFFKHSLFWQGVLIPRGERPEVIRFARDFCRPNVAVRHQSYTYSAASPQRYPSTGSNFRPGRSEGV